jgi:hypothetical protein
MGSSDVSPEETLEDPLMVVRSNADSMVGNGKSGFLSFP